MSCFLPLKLILMKNLFLVLVLLSSNAWAAITDLKLGFGQIWMITNISTSGSTYTIKAKDFVRLNDGVATTTWTAATFQPHVTAGRYMQLEKNAGAQNVYDHRLVLKNADGSFNRVMAKNISVARIGNGFMMLRSGGTVDAFGNNSGSELLGISMNSGYNLPDTTWTNFTGVTSSLPSASQLSLYIPPSDNTPIHGAGSVPLGGGSFGGGAPAPVYSSSITTVQTTELTAANTKVNNATLGNKIYLEEKAGTSGSIVNIEQSGRSNTVQGIGGGNAIISGVNNTINIKQGSPSSKNITEFSITGNSNKLTVWQARNSSTSLEMATDASNHYAVANITGNTNTLIAKQENAAGGSGSGSGHYQSTTITGSGNYMTVTQTGGTQKTFWGVVAGTSNFISVTQQGNSAKYLDLKLNGNAHTANVTQQGTGDHKATISLTNAGGASTLNLTQTGTIAQVYSINQSCATASWVQPQYYAGSII
jgi:hypothetical protein